MGCGVSRAEGAEIGDTSASRPTYQSPPGVSTRALNSDSIQLEDYRYDHAAALYRAYAVNPNVIAEHVMCFDSPEDLHNSLRTEDEADNCFPTHTSTILRNGDPIGAIMSSYPSNDPRKGVEIIGAWLGAEYRGKGIMTKAGASFSRQVFEVLHAPHVEFAVRGDNQPMHRLIGRLRIPMFRRDASYNIYKVTAEQSRNILQRVAV